jgi:hypothetical protein
MNGVFPSDVYGLIIDVIPIIHDGGYAIGNPRPCVRCLSGSRICNHLSGNEAKQVLNYAHVCQAWRKKLLAKKFAMVWTTDLPVFRW